MTKIIGIKELQSKTKQIRKDVENGISYIVIYRSKPVFEINPVSKAAFSQAMEATNLYTEKFIKKMQEAEEDLKKGNVKKYSTKEFLKSLK